MSLALQGTLGIDDQVILFIVDVFRFHSSGLVEAFLLQLVLRSHFVTPQLPLFHSPEVPSLHLFGE